MEIENLPKDKLIEILKKIYNDEYSEIISMFYGIHISIVSSLESNYLN